MFFVKNFPDILCKIKRKKVPPSSGIINIDKNFLNTKFLDKEAEDISNILKDFSAKIKLLEGKIEFFELCHRELELKNYSLKNTINQLIEQENNLEKYLLIAFNNIGVSLKKSNIGKSI